MNTNAAKLISVDWGTSNLRAYLVDANGGVIDKVQNDQGIRNSKADFASTLAALIEPWQADQPALNVILSGMIGSPSGWVEVPHLPCPATLADLAAQATVINHIGSNRAYIVPGLSGTNAVGVADIMRGEELQYFGAEHLRQAQNLPRPTLWCFPGTHNKWVRARMSIESFATSMVGEMFELIRQHSLLAVSLPETVPAPTTTEARSTTQSAAFAKGLAMASQSGGLLHHLFSVRTLQLSGEHHLSEGEDYLSGIMIGHDILAQLGSTPSHVGIVAAPQLAGKYAQALDLLGHSSFCIDAEQATTAGALLVDKRLAPAGS